MRVVDVTHHIERAVTALDMRAALAQLSPAHQQVVGELWYQSRSVAETAQRLGVPAGTVKSRAYYALRDLKRVLDPQSQANGTIAGRVVSRLSGGWQWKLHRLSIRSRPCLTARATFWIVRRTASRTGRVMGSISTARLAGTTANGRVLIVSVAGSGKYRACRR